MTFKAEIGVPQERLTGDVLRGHGPRRGNLEELIKYWRKRFRGRPPGAFRRCVISLADEPGVRQPPHALCAWLYHETTGKWPNEGRGKRGKSISKNRSFTKREKFNSCHIPEAALVKWAARELGGRYFEPINGRRQLIDYKASRFMSTKSRAVNTGVSLLLPGERGMFSTSPRRIGYNLLFGGATPGGRRVGGPRASGTVRNPYRCPPGFERGGAFTNRAQSTCGQQVLAMPGAVITSEIRDAAREGIQDARRTITGEEIKPSTSINLSQVARSRLAKLRGGVPPEVGRPNPGKQQAANKKLLAAMSRYDGKADLRRMVRSDGIAVTPLASLAKLASMDSDDFDGASYLTKVRGASRKTGVNEIALFGSGIRQLGFALDKGQVTISSSRKLSRREANGLRSRAASFTGPAHDFPMGSLVALANDSNVLKLEAFGTGVSEPNQKLRVKSEKGVVRVVPRWVFSLFLSKEAPMRGGDTPFTIVEEVGGATVEKAEKVFQKARDGVQYFKELRQPLLDIDINDTRPGSLRTTV